MSFYLETAIFINRAPFDNLKLNFKRSGINVLSAMNGKGKTTIISHIVDSFYEMAKRAFYSSFEGKKNKFYRISSDIFSINRNTDSIVYLRFKFQDEYIDYIDFRSNSFERDVYDKEIELENKVEFDVLRPYFDNRNTIKYISVNCDEKKIKDIFYQNVMTYFPAYRFEEPSYLNNEYKYKYQTKLTFSSKLKNPIEVITGIEDIVSWIMDIVLDWINNRQYKQIHTENGQISNIESTPELKIYSNLTKILNEALSSKFKNGSLRFGIARRNSGINRISIVNIETNLIAIPNIFNLSSGELSLICLFGEILRQADTLLNNIPIEEIHGIVLIDEVDMHLHIKLQKEILPKLFSLFPNVQFIISSHSPFFSMGLADILPSRSQIIDLDNGGLTCQPRDNELYRQVYNMIIEDNDKFALMYYDLLKKIKSSTKPLIIMEGKTDYMHLKNAIKRLDINTIDVDFFDEVGDFGSSKLEDLLENLAIIKPIRKIIGIFDRDEDKTLSKFDLLNNIYVNYENTNVYAFAIQLVNYDIYNTDKISIEHYYKKDDLLKEKDKRRLFLGEEFNINGLSKNRRFLTKFKNYQHKIKINGIIDDKVYSVEDDDASNNLALSKSAFAELVSGDINFSDNFDFSNFEQIIDIIKKIIDLE